VQQNLSDSREPALREPTVQLPVAYPENYGPANHPPANSGPRPYPSRNSRIPAPSAPASPAPVGTGDQKIDNAPPLAGAGGRVPAGRSRNRAVERHWRPKRNRSAAARAATRPFVRVRGRHAAMSRRQRWERRYVRTLVACDLGAGVAAGAVTFGLRFGNQVTAYNRAYLGLSALLPLALLVVLAVGRAYERRFLLDRKSVV